MKTIKEKLTELHEHEKEWNIEIGKIDKQIRQLQKYKSKLAIKISKNMKYRNLLINQL